MASEINMCASTQRVGWTASPKLPYGRGTKDILLSCLFTLLLCTWTVQHPCMPARSEKWYRISFRKCCILSITIIAPEMLIGAALGEFLLVNKTFKQVAEALHPDICWTATHSFFALMGGFRVEVRDRGRSIALLPINGKGIVALQDMTGLRVVSVTKDDIADKGKADSLVKATTVLQSLWMVIQIIARATQNLPITPLELATVGFVGCTVATYVAWWSKPQGAQVTITILSLSTTGTPLSDIQECIKKGWDDEVQISDAWRSSVRAALFEEDRLRTKHYFGGLHDHSMRISMFAGMLFGSVHIAGWNFYFPTLTETILWRTAAVTATAMPAALLMILLMTHFRFTWMYRVTDYLGTHWCRYGGGSGGGGGDGRSIGSPEWVVIGLYVVMRMYLIVALFITFRSQPLCVYKAVDWSKYIPHWS